MALIREEIKNIKTGRLMMDAQTVSKQSSAAMTMKRSFVLASLILAMFMAAIEATIVATAMPSIAADLGGFSYYSWVFSIFLLTQAVSIPIYGKLSDLFGRKPVFVFGASLFLIGCLLCGLSRTMLTLIIFRAVQGFGAGAIQPIATTIVGDIYTLEERAKIQGLLASVWGISSVLGPAMGGIIVNYFAWQWVFYINLPLGILAIAGIIIYLKESVEKKRHDIDYLGSALLFISVSTLLLAFLEGGVAWSWRSAISLFLFGVGLLGLLLFLWRESLAKEPILPLALFRHPTIAVANAASLLGGVFLIGMSNFIPPFVQGVLGKSAMIAGFTLGAMSIGWPLASTLSGFIILRTGFRLTAMLGGFGMVLSSVILLFVNIHSSPWLIAAGAFLMGVGLGLTTNTFIVSIQSAVGWKQRGVATSSNMFMRMLGSAIGAAVLGGILNSRLMAHLQSQPIQLPKSAEKTLDVANYLMDPELVAKLDASTVQLLKSFLANATHLVFVVILGLTIVGAILLFFLPNGKRESASKR
jgi:EmrB/QacA subfamily drug resistance transporter